MHVRCLGLAASVAIFACGETVPGRGLGERDAGPTGIRSGTDAGQVVGGDAASNEDGAVDADAGTPNGADGGAVGDGGSSGSDGGMGMDPDAGAPSDGGLPTGGDGGAPSGGDGGTTSGGDGGLPNGGDAGAAMDGGSTQDAGPSSDGGPTGADGGAPGDGGGASDAGVPGDGGIGAGSDAGAGADGGSSNDGGLGGPQSAFCNGSGAVVAVGTNICSGDVAQQTFRFGVCTCAGLQASSNLFIDGFDSSNGPYNASLPGGDTNAHSDGHIGVNGQLALAGRLTCMGSTFVSGGGYSVGNQSYVDVNVYAAGDAVQVNSSSTINRNAFVSGNVTGRYDINSNLYVPMSSTVDPQVSVAGQTIRGPVPAVTPCPCGPGDILDIQSLINFGASFNDNATLAGFASGLWATGTGPSSITLPCGRYYLTNILHPNTLTIRATGRTVLYIDGDLNVGGSLNLTVDPGAEIDVFIGGNLVPGASLDFGSPTQPSAVRTYIAGSGVISIGANATFGGNLYAPHANLLFSAATDIYGAVFCNQATFGGNAAIHFDTDIRSAGDDCTDGGVGGGADGGTSGGGADGGVVDAGSTGCTTCYECQQQACHIPPGQSTGTCGPCVTDVDCCPTFICVNGRCENTF